MTDEIGTAKDRIRVYPADRERINELRSGGDTQADVIKRLLADEDGEDIPIADIREAAREGAREAIAELEGRP